jgi:hypothetical protein
MAKVGKRMSENPRGETKSAVSLSILPQREGGGFGLKSTNHGDTGITGKFIPVFPVIPVVQVFKLKN